ncbi:MAG: TatD family hydrolase [Eubacterium sp.]|nr:TatD family hydrolase [Eubacterium sp.]
MLTDSHAHLDDARFEGEVPQIIENARAAGIGFILNPGCEEKSSARAVELSETWKEVYAAVGFHPSDCAAFEEDTHIPMLETWLSREKTLAVGEIGLDYYYDDGAPKALQKKVFEIQMDLANRVGKPIIVHDRDAHGDCLAMVKTCLMPETGGVFHCYSGSVEMARELLDFGLYISIGGPLTFKNSRKAPDVVKYVPMDRLLIETDSPYLAPVPFRGKRNEPAYVRCVAEKVAELKEMSVEAVMAATAENCRRLFKF